MTYVTKKCPYCKHAYQVLKTGDQRVYGCPLKICETCGKAFWDTDIKEPALHGYKNAYETRKKVTFGITLALYTPFSILILVGSIWALFYGEMIGVFGIIMGAGIIWAIIAEIKQKIDDKNRQDIIIKRQQDEYDQSLERLKNTSYLEALANHDGLAKRVLQERKSGKQESYAERPH